MMILAISIENDDVVIRFSTQRICVPDFAGVLRVVLEASPRGSRCRDVERAHRQLCARFADGLGGDDAAGLPELRKATGAEVRP